MIVFSVYLGKMEEEKKHSKTVPYISAHGALTASRLWFASRMRV